MKHIPAIKLTSGSAMPQVALGMWKNTSEAECIDTVKAALKAGYCHFDTAQAYHNESFLGKALKEAGVGRQDVFITTKIAVQHFGHKRAKKSFQESLEALQTDYVDLLLLHFPVTLLRKSSWKALEEIFESGQAKNIGVSNFTIRHLKELLADCKIRPAVNQVELHIYLQQPELVAFCKQEGIVIEAYSPLAHNHGLDNPVLAEIAAKYSQTPAQIMLRWCVEVGAVPLPKSTHENRLKENIDIFDFKLDSQDLAKLKKLNQNLRTCWDPTRVP